MSNQQKLCVYCGKRTTNMAAKYCADPKCGEPFSEPGKPKVVDLLYSPPIPPIKKIKFPMPPQLKRESSSSEEDAKPKCLLIKRMPGRRIACLNLSTHQLSELTLSLHKRRIS